MGLGLAYWIVFLIVLILGLIFNRPTDWRGGLGLAVFLLLLILGWAVFGPPIHS